MASLKTKFKHSDTQTKKAEATFKKCLRKARGYKSDSIYRCVNTKPKEKCWLLCQAVCCNDKQAVNHSKWPLP